MTSKKLQQQQSITDNRDLSCYYVTKHSWRGKYKRIFSIGTHGITTYEPSTLEVTNTWPYEHVISLTPNVTKSAASSSTSSHQPTQHPEYVLTFRKQRKSDNMKFSCEYRSDIITDALRFQTLFYSEKPAISPRVYSGSKIHWSSQRPSILLRVQTYCLDQIDAQTNRYLCSYDYKDIEQIQLLAAGDVAKGFLLQDKQFSRLHAFLCEKTDELLTVMADLAQQTLGITLKINKKSATPITINDYVLNRFGRYSSDEHLTSFAEFVVYKYTPRHQDDVGVRRILCITETCLLERDPQTYNVCTLKPLTEVYALIRHVDNLQLFTVEYLRGKRCKYTSSERDILLATLLDSVRSSGNNDCCVKTTLTDRGKRFAPFTTLVDDDVEIQHVKFLVQLPTGGQTSNDPSPSSPAPSQISSFSPTITYLEVLKRFNANVPYSGLINAVTSEGLFAENKEKLIHTALNSLLDNDTTTQDAEYLEDQYHCLRRLLASKAGFQAFTQLPKFRERIGVKIVKSLKLGDDNVTCAAIEMLNTLLQPIHLDYDIKQEQLNKSSILSSKKFLETLLDIFLKNVKQNTGSLIISSFLDFLTYTLCQPFSETTDGQHFDVLLELVSTNGRTFFKLFQHSSFTIVKGAGLIMKSIIEEGSNEISAHMQDLALSECALPIHLLRALYTSSSDTRLLPLKYLSQNLIALWSTGHPTTYGLLKRIFPLGLLAYLDSNEQPEKDLDDQSITRDNLKLANEHQQQQQKGLNIGSSIAQTANKIRNTTQVKVIETHVQTFLQHWSIKLKQSKKIQKSNDNDKPIVLRKPRQRIKAEKNWKLFYQKFQFDHIRPTLIWNNKTREELRETIEQEIRNFNIDKDIGHGHLISWNYQEFEVLYTCLYDEIKIGTVYLRLLLEQDELIKQATSSTNNDELTGNYEPHEFFNDLYHRFLLSSTSLAPGMKSSSMKSMCLQAMTIVYGKYAEQIGPFNDTRSIVQMLDRCIDRTERDRLLLFIQKLILNIRNVRDLIDCGGIKLLIQLMCLAHLHINRACVPLQTNVIESSSNMNRDSEKEWYYGKQDKEKLGPYSFQELKEFYQEGIVDTKTKFWAQGMEGWKLMERIPQLKWTMLASGQSLLNESDMCALILDILIQMCDYYPSRDLITNSIIRPLPKIKRILNDSTCLPHLVQLLLTFDPQIVEKVVVLLNLLIQDNPMLTTFYMSGIFYFILMYTGSNILPIGHFLKYSHLKQAFRSDLEQTSQNKQNDLIYHSVLGHMLPEAMICYLENYGPEKFAQMFLGEYDQPETIWSNEMRRLMIEKIAVHLADYSPRLMSNIYAVYQYCNIPVINYPQLENELFCNQYYLRHLCDEKKFPDWPIKDPIALLKDCLQMWKSEIEKKPSDMSVEEAYEVLGIEIKSKEQQTTNNNESGKSDNQSTFQQPSEASIRKAYFKLAQKYHPDKNPDGREMFVKVNKAYEFLCLASRIKQGPNDFNLYLLLKTQTILYRRYKQILSEYKYAGYPMLIRILDQEWKNDQLFSLENTSQTALLPISIELLYYTLDCSELNCEELRRENGLEILTQVFQRCAGVLTKASKSDDFIVKISNYSALCYGVCGHFEKCRDLFVNTDLQCILKEICHCFNYTHLKQLCTSLCKASRSLCIQDQRLRDMFYKHGLLVYLCLGLFNYDYTLEESGIEMDIEKGDNRQYIDNQLSFDYMATLITLLHDNKDSFCLNTSCTFLTSYIVKQMLKIQPDESQLDNKDKYRPLLKLLNSNTETPYMIWDNSCRQELVEYLEQTRQILMKNEYKLNIDEFGRNFSYTAHKNELIIGDIFVRIYNLQPTTVLEEPKKFCTDLLDFLGTSSQYINTLISMKQQQQPQGDDSSKTVDVIQLEKQAHIEQALEALKNVIRNNIGIETLCLGHFKLLFSLLRMDNIHRTQILALELILHITGSNECVQDISQSNVIVYLLLALKSSPSKVQNDIQQLVLDILACLCSNTKIVKDLFTSGGLLYLLDIFANGQNSNIREKSAETMSKLMSDRLHGPRIRLILQKFLPSLFMDAMRDSCETSIQLFETQHENPELIWNDHIREMTCERISQLLTEFYSKQKLDPTEVKWSIDDNFLLLADDDEATRISQTELIIGGVYIRLLIQNPGWIVRRPKEFLTELLTRWSLNIKHPLEAHVNEFEMLTQCLMQLLNAQPTLCEHIPSIGFLPTIIQGLECKDNNSICASSIKILYQLSKNETCIQTMSTTCPQIISGFRIAMTIRHDHLGLIAECLHSLFKIPNNDEFIRDALKCQLIDYILTLLGQPLVDIEKPGSCKAHLVDTCKLMTQSLTYGEQILKILQQSTVWNDYKDQRHDLFIQTSTHMQAITGGSSGPAIAGYLTSTPSQIQQKIPPPIIDHGMD